MIYVISDIHGDYHSFYKMLLKINFSSSDYLYILGDVVDKGSDNLYLLEFIRHMENACLVKGNHEYLFERYLQGTITASLWDACGGSATRSEADSLPEEKKRELLAYLKALPIYKIITEMCIRDSESPVGQALIGKKVGETADVETQAGVIQYKVLEISRSK